MSSQKPRVAVRGSERVALQGTLIGAPDPNQRIEVTVRVRRRNPLPDSAALEAQAVQPKQRRHLSREAFEAAYGADPEDIAKVEEFAHEHGLTTVTASAARRSVVLAGTVAAMSEAFGVYLAHYQTPEGIHRGRTGVVSVPEDLVDIVEGVFGLDNRPQARPHFRRLNGSEGLAPNLAQSFSYSPDQLAKLYSFPQDVNGKGQCIAIIELGGGFRTQDLTTYFAHLGIPKPKVVAVSVDGGHNQPSTPDSDDGEVMLDIEVAGAVAPGAKIVVYFAPNTDQGFLDAITTAIHDNHNKPSVISISWGSAEKNWTPQAMQTFDQAFQSAAHLGVTVCAAAGDDGSADRVNDGRQHVDFPASSSFVLACGGTHVEAPPAGPISLETVWNHGPGNGATGGGISDVFDLPAYQANAQVPPSANPDHRVGRGVPDIAADADPSTGYRVRVDGQDMVIGGTSAVAPLWAGLIALLNQKQGTPAGFINPFLYSHVAGVFKDITVGNNGAYPAHTGWDACTGLGSANGTALVHALLGQMPAGSA